jgi:hypothetical protein
MRYGHSASVGVREIIRPRPTSLPTCRAMLEHLGLEIAHGNALRVHFGRRISLERTQPVEIKCTVILDREPPEPVRPQSVAISAAPGPTFRIARLSPSPWRPQVLEAIGMNGPSLHTRTTLPCTSVLPLISSRFRVFMKPFGLGVVVRIADAAHTGLDIKRRQDFRVFDAGILDAAIRMMD